ncbi:MAG TPA: iron export ABC transporter permease subunit FetB, partial [Thiotrichales bacterium]|nr:iron export ABC transporter permease subunit FetB [Thiotrichales bacterium]
MNQLISLGYLDLGLAALLVLALIGLVARMQLGLSAQLLVAAVRTAVQLSLLGLILKAVFAGASIFTVAGMSLVMLVAAAMEILSRQKRKLHRRWGFSISIISLFISSFLITVFALLIIIRVEPWYTPQYAIPLLGMLLGNTMNGIALGMDRLVQTAWQQRMVIEQRLMLGQTAAEAIRDIRRDSMRAGMIPIINAMAAAGIVSLPGMMTGQILAGSSPQEAVNYQILIMFLITAGTGFGVVS